MNKLIISVDFDGVIVVENYPDIGNLMTGAKETINKWYNQGHTILINTCRAGVFLERCKDFLYANSIMFHHLNENPPELIKRYGMDTRKLSADIYIDDRNMGGFRGWKHADKYVHWMAYRKPLVIAIVGESGSGKSTLAEYIRNTFGIHLIQSYTTRPRRTPDEDGHTFISDEEFDTFDDMIAFTEFGKHRYCCRESDVKEENTYVIDEHGLQMLKANYGEVYDIKTIRVRCGTSERIDRVGEERVARDKGRFNLPAMLFDLNLHTDSWRKPYHDELDEYILKWTNRL